MRARVLLVVAIAYLLACTACKSRPPGDILLVTVDTLRADHMGLYGYPRPTTPRVDAWFADDRAMVFERSYSTSASTPPSIVSLLSGRTPPEHGVRLFHQLLAKDVPLVPDLLPDAYATAAFVSNVVLTDEALGIAGRFDHYDDFVDERESSRELIYERRAERTTDAALAWLPSVPRERPVFVWVHYIDPHGPYRAPPDRPVHFTHDEPIPIDPVRVPRYQREPGVRDGARYVDRYDEEIAYTDLHVGRLLDGFTALRSADDALVVFSADHGETMMDHEQWFTHGYYVYEQIIHVPLMIRGPGMPRGRFDAVVSGIDVAQTILGFVTGAPRVATDARDLAAGAIPADRIVWSEAAAGLSHRAAVSRDGKWVVSADPTGTVREREYFDLAADPAESQRQPWDGSPAAGRDWLAGAVASDPDPGGFPAEYARGSSLTGPKVADRVSEPDRERLRALGYVD